MISAYQVFSQHVFKSKPLLLDALRDLGFDTIEEGVALPLYGYHGDMRPERAEVVVRRQYVGSASNDIGFTLTEAGYVPIVSDFDSHVRQFAGEHQGRFVPCLHTAYNRRAVAEVARRVRGKVTSKKEGQVEKLVVRF